MPEDKLIKWVILDPAAETRSGVLAVAVFHPQGGIWYAYIGAYTGNSLQNEAAKVAKHGTKLERQVAGLIFSRTWGDLNSERMKAGAEPYRWRA